MYDYEQLHQARSGDLRRSAAEYRMARHAAAARRADKREARRASRTDVVRQWVKAA